MAVRTTIQLPKCALAGPTEGVVLILPNFYIFMHRTNVDGNPYVGLSPKVADNVLRGSRGLGFAQKMAVEWGGFHYDTPSTPSTS